MPLELRKLKEQLLTLKIVYEDAVYSDLPSADLKKIKDHIEKLEKLIEERKVLITRNQSPN